MFYFGKWSRKNLKTCHPDLQKLFNEVIMHVDCSVICGHRGEEDQNKAYHEGRSKLKYPHSKHNKKPSLAADVVPYPIDWQDANRFYMFAGVVRGIAAMMNIEIRCGADWDGDMEIKDQNFHDVVHFELRDT